MLHGTIRNDDFLRNTALPCWNNIATINRRCKSPVKHHLKVEQRYFIESVRHLFVRKLQYAARSSKMKQALTILATFHSPSGKFSGQLTLIL